MGDVLRKAARPTREEWSLIRRHPDWGADALAEMHLMPAAVDGVRSHHERWDGSGYPRGLSGNEIPLVGQIVAVADVFDTLINERPYKRAWAIETAVAEIRRKSGRWFSPRIVEAFMKVLADQPELLERLERESHEDTRAARAVGPPSAATSTF